MKLYKVCLILVLFCCEHNNSNKNFEENNFLRIDDLKISELDTKVDIGAPRSFLLKDYFVVCDNQQFDEGIHIYSRKDLMYIKSIGEVGRGPNEIIAYKHCQFIPNEKKNELLIVDCAKYKVFKLDIDKNIRHNQFSLDFVANLSNENFIVRNKFLNDSILIGSAAIIKNNSLYKEYMSLYNINTRHLKKFGDDNSSLKGYASRFYFNFSQKHNLLVKAYSVKDQISFCDMHGKLKFIVKGNLYDKNKKKNKYDFYSKSIQIVDDVVYALYSGREGYEYDENKRLVGTYPRKILMFDVNGKYMKTINFNIDMKRFLIDKKYNRVIITTPNFDSQIGYFDYSIIN
jgi:hypothetical protein